MNSERLWIVILMIATFCAGIAGGILLIQGAAPVVDGTAPGPFAPYRDRLIEEYELDSARRRDLEVALREYAEQIDLLRERSLRGLEPELIRAGEDCFLKIRDYVIPPDRRPEFDRLAVGEALSSPSIHNNEAPPGPPVH